MTPEYNEYGFLVKRKKAAPKEELNEFGFPIKKKESQSGSVLEAGSEETLPFSLPSMSVLGKAQKSIEEFNRQFEDISGYRTFDLSDPVKKPGLLSQDYFNRRKAEAEKEKFTEYKGEEKEINDVLFNVHTGNTSVNELAALASKPYGKNAVREVLAKYAPETPIGVYGDEILNKGVHWSEAVTNIKTKNRFNADQMFAEGENESLENIQSAINSLQIKTEVSDYIATPGGGALKSDATATDQIPAIDIKSPESVASALKFLDGKGYLVDKEGKKSDYSLDKLYKDLSVIYERLKNTQPIAPEIESLSDKIFNAVTSKQILAEVGEEKTDYGVNDQTRANHFKIGLNYIKEIQPGTYKGVLLGLENKGEISETDYQQISRLGQDVYNKQVFRDAAYNPELIDKETNFDYRTHQDIKSEYSRDIGEWLKSNGYRNFRVYPAELIKRAATAQGLENKEVVNELILEEGGGGYDAIPKTGGTEAGVRGIMQPIAGIVSTFKKWFTESPAETYLRSKKLDTGTGQKVPDVFGNISNELPSDRNNTWYDILEGAGQFIPQVVLTRGIGGGLAGATRLSLSQVPRAALTAAQASNISAYGGTFTSAFLQTYGNAYSDALSKTGDPATARLMGGIDAVTTSLAELILPDVRIAAKAFSGIKGQFVNDVADLVKKGGDISTLRKSARPFIEKFVTNTVGIQAQEVSEEVVTQWANYIDESIFSPGTVKDRDLGKETWDTIKATAVSMIIPSVLGAGGASLNKDFTKQGLHAAAINFEDYKSSLQKSLINDNITQDEFNLGIKILGTHRESIFASPAASENGAKLTNDQRTEYAYQDTIIKIEKEKSSSITGVQKELSEKKIKEAENIQREILMPKETKTEELSETEQPITELTDQEKSVIDLIKEKTELSFLDPATQGRIIYDAAQNPATQKEAIQMLVDQSSDPESLELSVGAKVTEAVLGLPQKSTQKTQEELTGEAAAISAADQAPEAAPITTVVDEEQVEVDKPKIRVTAEQVQERQPAKIREQYIENYALDIDSKYNWKITSVMNGEERRKAIMDIRTEKNTAPARKLEKEIQGAIERGVININRGGGSQTQNVEIPINEWFSFTPIEQNKAIQEAENTEIEDNFIASIVRNNEITLQNIDDLKNLFNGFPYNEQDFSAVKTFLSGETTGITQTESISQEGQQPAAAEETPTITEQGADLAAKIRQLKTKRDTLQANIFGIPIAIYDGLIETIATAVENGAKLADAISSAINSIKDKNFDREGFKKSVEDFAAGKRPKVTTEGEIADVSVPTKNEGEEFEVSDENLTGITHAQTEVTRERFVLPQYDKNPETIAGWDAEADKLISEGFNIQELLNKMANGYMPSPVEQRIMIKYIASLESKVEKNPSDENLTELKRAIELSDRVGGSEVGKALVARKGSIHRDDSLATFLIREMEENGVDVLTEEQKSKVKKEYEEIRAANAAYKKKIEELQEENARLKAGETVSKERQRARKGRKTTEEFQDERKKISESIREKLKKSRSEVSATLVPYAKELITIAPDVAKLMRSYVEEGITKLADIVDNIHGVLKDEINGITKKDVLDIIAGEYAEPKQTRNELAATLRDLKTEATLVNQFEKLEQGEVPITEKKRIRRNQELSDLRQKIKEHDLTKTEDAKKRIKTRIEKIEEQLRTGNFEIPEKKLPIKLDREGRELQDKLIKLKQDREVRILTERYNNRSARDKAIDRAIEIANVPRSIMASMDYSAPLRQAIIATIAHPRTAVKAATEMFISSFSQKNFDRWFFDLKNDPRYDLMQETGLSVTDPHSPFLTAKEEAYMNNLTEKIPIIGRLIKGSERAYVQYLNKMRVDLFNRFADRFEEQGKTFENSKDLYEKMAGYINNQTGRGKIGKLEDSAPVLNAIFFSPRLIASRLNLLNPVYFAKLPKELKIMYGKDMAKFIGVGLSVVALAQFAGGGGDEEDKITVETDPRSSDFMKIRQKNTRWDIWGGFQPYIRLIAQMITGEAKSAGTGKIYDIDGKGAFGRDRLDVLGTFFRNKLAPIPAGSYNILSGRNTVGEDVTLGSQLKESLIPLNFTSIKESVNDEGIKALFTVGIPSTFGVGTATYEPKVSKGDTIKIYQESGSKVREATQEEYDKYIQDRDKKAEEKLDKIEKRKTVWLNKYGEITIDEKAKTKVKQFDKLTEDELKDLQSRLKSQAANEVKKTIKY